MSQREKLNLIENYISIYKLLFNCRNISINKKDTLKINTLSKITDKTIQLKNNYENTFDTLGLIDDSFLQLQKELNECLTQTGIIPICNLNDLQSTLLNLQSDFLKVKEKYTL